jgi:hypothetical protein
MNTLIACPNCRAWLLDGVFNQPALTPCPSCHTPIQIEAFPALFRKITPGESAQPVMVEGESSCFFHPEKKAVVLCAGCGRFMCTLCDCPFEGQHYCPACLDAGRSKGKIKNLENRRARYDNIALSLALLPPLTILGFFYFTFITTPLALFFAIHYWRAPRSIVGGGNWRFILAIVLALLQLGAWLAMVIAIVAAIVTHRS